MKKSKQIILTFLLLFAAGLNASAQSVAGLYQIDGSGRIVYNFNQGWRFHLGDVDGAENVDFTDKNWEIVCCPHTAQLVPSEASGGRNYQGICWYRKHFVVPADMNGKDVSVHFEAIMGKQKVFVNGKLATEHLGGYLPITIHLNKFGVKAGDECLIAVMADNSDDKSYPPGKKQSQLDFAYHAGIYRDVWLIGKSDVAITDAIEADKVAGGGVFLHYGNITEEKAEVFIDVDLQKPNRTVKSLSVEAKIIDADGKTIKTIKTKSTDFTARFSTSITHPHLWSPENPYLYKVELRVIEGGRCVDGGMLRMGIRRAEFRGKDGFYLNGRPYHQLIGGNRHQDFAYVGNAMPNSQQWRDAKRLKDAGMHIIRAAHYPQDPAFMDACDELGLFVIVPTPGWQYWNKDPKFAELVHKNTREIIRRDRNHTCVLMWEPILNETRYPKNFSVEAHKITIEEFPYEGRPVAAADMNSEGVKENYEVMYGWPEDVANADVPTDKCIFTREFGEMVDDWYAHNCLNRAPRFWGEKAMLTAALSLSKTYSEMFTPSRQFIGGCQWHPFDHQRGYHPDPYFGGIYDVFRQPKYQLAAFKAKNLVDSTPYLYIAHEMTQFSDEDVVVFTNCDSVRLTFLEGQKTETQVTVSNGVAPQEPIVFRGFWNFWDARECSYKQRNWQKVSLVAEGYKDGKIVCTEKKMPSRRSTKLRLYVDSLGKELTADGSDFIVVVAEVTDDNGNVRRLAKESVVFTIEGEGRIIGDASIGANPRLVEWGSAPILVQATDKPGKITITARPLYEGIHAPTADTITIESHAPVLPACYKEIPTGLIPSGKTEGTITKEVISEADKKKLLDEVEKQQQDFGVMK
ncbi:MAG: glycoside hydrolase family 2 TIM barrel-domain containing protein [Prevotellaceae bacterium]|nr:glycoside hydrolase family 2 TIM barrel-domain containing protein [Prevotellaceae bacterium]